MIRGISSQNDNADVCGPALSLGSAFASDSICTDALAIPSTSKTSTLIKQKPLNVQYRMTHFTHKPVSTSKSKELDKQLLKLVASDYLAFSIVENEEFKKFVNLLNPSYNLPSRKTMSQNLLVQMYNDVHDKVKNILDCAVAMCVTTDGWTSMTTDSYIALTAHFIDDECIMRSVLLDCFNFNDRHTSENLLNEINRVLIKWGIQDKIIAVVTDNAANVTAAVRQGGWKHLPCLAHSLNLVVQSGLKEISETHIKIKSIVEYFKKSTQATQKLLSTEVQMGLPELKLKQDMPVRWNSTFYMFDRILKIKEAVISTLALLNYDKHQITQNDWEILELSTRILKYFEEVTVDLSAEKNVTLSKVIYYSRALMRSCKAVQQELGHPIEIYNMVSKMIEQMGKRFFKIEENSPITEATILDPRFKRQGFSDHQSYERAKQSIISVASQINIIKEQTATDPVSTSTESTNKSVLATLSIWEDYDNSTANMIENENTLSASIVEMNRYVQEPLQKRTENPLLWWKDRKLIYPRLFEIMKKRLCVTATSVPCERVFSKAGMILTEKRSRLKPGKIQMLLFINSNGHLL